MIAMLVVGAALVAQDVPPTPLDCYGAAHVLDVAPGPARQGATIAIRAKRFKDFGESDELAACTSDWKLSDPKMATLAADRRSLTIAPDAAPGGVLTLSYRADGEPVSVTLRIVARDAIALNGRYRSTQIDDCDGAEIGELEFGDTDFSLTFRPFERYRDYWGRYAFDAATGALVLTITGGNTKMGVTELRGRAAKLGDGRLTIAGLNLGKAVHRPKPGETGVPLDGPCRYTFG